MIRIRVAASHEDVNTYSTPRFPPQPQALLSAARTEAQHQAALTQSQEARDLALADADKWRVRHDELQRQHEVCGRIYHMCVCVNPNTHRCIYIYIHIYIYIYMCVCVCVCVRVKRKSERERAREADKWRVRHDELQRQHELTHTYIYIYMCVRVCVNLNTHTDLYVCVYVCGERERESDKWRVRRVNPVGGCIHTHILC